MRAVVIRRVSTDEQADSGNGLNAQLDACERWAQQSGAELVGPFDDEGICGAASLDKRTGLLAALAELKRGDVLLVAKRDRLGRDPILVAMVESAAKRKGARVVSAAGEGTDDDSPTSVLMRRMIDAFAEYERLVIGARTKAALQAKIKRGERCGKIRFGYDLAKDGKTLVPNEREQAVLQEIREARANGRTFRWIASNLTQKGVPTKAGKAIWCHTTVASVLSR